MYKNDTVFYPQDEITTVLLPVTLGCSYNKCMFCSMYKDDSYCEVPFGDIEMQLMNGYTYTEKVFLTGADPMSIGFDRMKAFVNIRLRNCQFFMMGVSDCSISVLKQAGMMYLN